MSKYTAGQLQGMLLEEAVLYLLRVSGYKTVEDAGTDPTLRNGHSGLEVRGRGSRHQIDAVADYIIPQPFSNPSRLLVEAKFYDRPVGIDVVRNTVGVLKDVAEFWVPAKGQVSNSRYHYQSAVVSATGFSSGAQRFAFAHDIYLIPLEDSAFFQPLLDAIRRCGEENSLTAIRNRFPKLKDLRSQIRQDLRDNQTISNNYRDQVYHSASLREFLSRTHHLQFSLLAILGERFPIFLTPANRDLLTRLNNRQEVVISWNHDGWYLNDSEGERLFSFDLPKELFALYASQGFLTPKRAIDLKRDFMSAFRALLVRNGRIQVINFEINQDWLNILLRKP